MTDDSQPDAPPDYNQDSQHRKAKDPTGAIRQARWRKAHPPKPRPDSHKARIRSKYNEHQRLYMAEKRAKERIQAS